MPTLVFRVVLARLGVLRGRVTQRALQVPGRQRVVVGLRGAGMQLAVAVDVVVLYQSLRGSVLLVVFVLGS